MANVYPPNSVYVSSSLRILYNHLAVNNFCYRFLAGLRCPGQNQIYKLCGQAAYCEPTCGVPENSTCNVQFVRCPEGCQCESGYKRNPKTGMCVRNSQCPNVVNCRKDLNERFHPCGNRQEDCPYGGKICKNNNCIPACYCMEGYKRVNGVCISKYYASGKSSIV